MTMVFFSEPSLEQKPAVVIKEAEAASTLMDIVEDEDMEALELMKTPL